MPSHRYSVIPTLSYLNVFRTKSWEPSLGYTRPAQRDFLRLEANIEPLVERFKKNDEILYDKYLQLPVSDARRQLVETFVPRRQRWRPNTVFSINQRFPREERTPGTGHSRNSVWNMLNSLARNPSTRKKS